jgi:hypothetical protein
VRGRASRLVGRRAAHALPPVQRTTVDGSEGLEVDGQVALDGALVALHDLAPIAWPRFDGRSAAEPLPGSGCLTAGAQQPRLAGAGDGPRHWLGKDDAPGRGAVAGSR